MSKNLSCVEQNLITIFKVLNNAPPKSMILTRSFAEYEITSMQLWRLRVELEELYGVTLPIHLFSERSTPKALIEYFRTNRSLFENRLDTKAELFLLSGNTPEAVTNDARITVDWLKQNPAYDLSDVCYESTIHQQHHPHRLAVVASSANELAEKLHTFANGDSPPGLFHNTQRQPPRKLAFVFSGYGGVWWRMGRELLETEPVFAETLHNCDRILQEIAGWSLFTELEADETHTRILETDFINMLSNVVVQLGLAELWRSWGVIPGAVVGHSTGEITAAYVAEILTLEEAVHIIEAWGRLGQSIAGTGRMVAVDLSAAETKSVIKKLDPQLFIAGNNSPHFTVVSGNTDAIQKLVMKLEHDEVFYRELKLKNAWHSPCVDSIRPRFEAELSSLKPKNAKLPIYSALTGNLLDGPKWDTSYWGRNLRELVRFASAIEQMAKDGYETFLEVNPHPVLERSIEQTLNETGQYGAVVHSLKRDTSDRSSLLEAVGKLYTLGYELNFERLYPYGGRRVSLPIDTQQPKPDLPETVEIPPTVVEVKKDDLRETPDTFLSQLHTVPQEERAGFTVKHLSKLVANVLGIQSNQFSETTPLNELNIDSVMTIELQLRIDRATNVRLPLLRLWKASVSELGDMILENLPDTEQEPEQVGDNGHLVSLTPDPQNWYVPFPLNDIQYSYYVGRQGIFEWGNIPTHFYMEFDDNLDPVRLNRAWWRVIERHDALRTVFLPSGEQQIRPTVDPYEITVVDLRGQDPGIVEEVLKSVRLRMESLAPTPSEWPHFEVVLHLLDNGRTRLHINFDLMIVDLFSIGLLFRDWGDFYNDHQRPDLTLSVRDYSLAVRRIQDSDRAKKALAYWQERLDHLPSPPQLPHTLTPDPVALKRPTIKHSYARLSEKEWARLKQRAQAEGLTPSTVLCAAMAEVFSFWCKEPIFTLNLTQFQRFPLHPQVNEIVGDFTSTILLAVDWTKDKTFVERARRLTQQLWADMDHSVIGGIKVMGELQAQRRERILFPVVFTSGLDDLGPYMNWAGELHYMAGETSQVLIDNRVHEHNGELIYCWDVLEEYFPEGMIALMFDAYSELIHQLAAEDEETWGQAPRRHLVATQWARCAINDTQAPLTDYYLHTLAERHFLEQPEQPAVIAHNCTLTYGALHRLATFLGKRLRDEGVKPNTLVAVIIQPGWERVVAVYAVLYSGAAYVPIDPAWPEERILYLLENTRVSHVLSQSWFEEIFDWPDNVTRICVDEQEMPAQVTDLGKPVQDQRDLAYVIFTSGSTGQPKGVMIEHQGAVNTCVDINTRFAIGPKDRVFGLSKLNFDLSVYDIFGILGAGGAIVYPSPGAEHDPSQWIEPIGRHQVTIWNTVPALMNMLVDYVEEKDQTFLQSLRLVMMSGDWIPVDLPDRIRNLVSSVKMVSLGGATEASIWSVLYEINEVDPSWPSIPYGHAMVNQRIYVLNHWLEPCPPWATGELYIGGVGLARGYWRNEKRTEASFFEHPVTHERLYRTGDLGRYRDDGEIEFLGREDSQIKLQGFRIELGEIEANIRLQEGVKEAYVMLRQSQAIWGQSGQDGLEQQADDNRVLIAYVVPQPGYNLEEDELRAFLQRRIPHYMIPARFLIIDEIPLSANGKINRNALPSPDSVIRSDGKDYVAPRTDNERIIADMWSELLGLPTERIGISDNFFDLGGNSLLIVRLSNALSKRFNTDVRIVDLFEYSTVERMANLVGQTAKISTQKVSVTERARQRALKRKRLIRRR